VINTIDELRSFIEETRAAGKTIGLVPTMGALHEGHLSLARRSVEQTDITVATIFVNPTQFASGEDLSVYPRPLERDLKLLASVGVDVAFVPSDEDMYPPGCSTTVSPPELGSSLEGEFRPTHFRGVLTIVLKLFNLVQADVALFGRKDYQQSLVIRKMVDDLNVPTRIEVCPIVRDPDGLAMSSRSVYLGTEEREIALSLKKTLDLAKEQIEQGQRDGFELITEMRQSLIDSGVTSIDYAVVADPQTLETLDPIQLPCVLLIAAHVGNTRLIDNCIVEVG
jgi:pantoate--beta-alanine ligase